MGKRNFANWLATFRNTIANYGYYTDFPKVFENANKHKREICLLSSLIGEQNIEEEFEKLIKDYPQVLECIPILLAVRSSEIPVFSKGNTYNYTFDKLSYSIDQYKEFMRETGLFGLLKHHIIQNLYDYVTGVETGLDSNGRKNRGGDLMENLVEDFIKEAGFVLNKTYFKELTTTEITKRWGIDLSQISNDGKTTKRYDFVIKTPSTVYAIETNFYSSSGSKLNETARSYKNIAIESKGMRGFQFVWITDGLGWLAAKHNLEETFDVLENLYNITDLQNGLFKTLV